MPLSLRTTGWDQGTKAKRSARSVAEARAELERLEAEQAEAEREAREDQARVKREREQAHRQISQRLAGLREEYARPLTDPERPGPVTRRNAREFLHPGPDSNPVTLLGVLATVDGVVGAHHARSQAAGRAMSDAAAADVGGELVDQLDDLEVQAWGACMRRIRVLAGEEAP